MPKPTRLSVLITAAFIAACAGPGQPQGSPAITSSPTAPPTPSPATSATPSRTPAATLLPESTAFDGCVDIDDIDAAHPFVDATTTVGHAGMDIQVTRITERSGNRESVTPPAREIEVGSGLLVGGHEFLTHPSTYYEGHDTPTTMVSATVTLTLDGAAPVELPVRIVPGNEYFDQVAVAVPDVAGRGTLAFEMTWTDRCFELAGSGSTAVEVVPTSVTDGCALEKDGYFAELEAAIKPGLAVGGVTTKYFVPGHRAKYFDYENPPIDAFILYLFGEEQPTVTLEPGSVLRIENRGDALLASEFGYWIWTRASVAAAIKDYPPMGSVEVAHRSPDPQPDGSWRLRAPTEAGRYVAAFELDFETQCGTGFAWAMVKLTVDAP